MIKKRILIDVDGVLNTYSGIYNENVIPPIRKNTKYFLSEIAKSYNIVLFSSREPQQVKKWTIENGIDKYITQITNKKLPAFLIIDDRCIPFNGDEYQTLEAIKKFNVWWKE